jgi:deazaflavin-dependent oxidoreductase (nitroreductase family)
MLEHRGRVSGEARYVCLEIVERPGPGRYIVVSGFGTQAQWYRNLGADPRCFVSTGRLKRAPAHAVMLHEAEARATLDRYEAAHPADWRVLRGTIEKAIGHPVDGLPMVELTLDKV